MTLMSNAVNVEGAAVDADLVICAVLIPGAKAPCLITYTHVLQMDPGSALVVVTVGYAEASRPTTHHAPRVSR